MTSISQTSALASASALASIASTSSSDDNDDNAAIVGSVKGFDETILRPYMGLLPLEQPNDPWTQKAYNPIYPLYSGGGSYEAYLRPRRDTHIMARSHQMLTPGMLERLLRIKAEFQRRFPHLYQSMLNHHTNQTRVEVKPPLLVRLNNNRSNFKEEAPVYELGAAERGLFDEDEAQADASHEATTERNESSPFDSKEHETKKGDHDDDDVDYFRFEDDDDNDNNYNKNTDPDIIDD